MSIIDKLKQHGSEEYLEAIAAVTSAWIIEDSLFLIGSNNEYGYKLLMEDIGCFDEFKEYLKKVAPQVRSVWVFWSEDGKTRQMNRVLVDRFRDF
jgi:hypothetical protein